MRVRTRTCRNCEYSWTARRVQDPNCYHCTFGESNNIPPNEEYPEEVLNSIAKLHQRPHGIRSPPSHRSMIGNHNAILASTALAEVITSEGEGQRLAPAIPPGLSGAVATFGNTNFNGHGLHLLPPPGLRIAENTAPTWPSQWPIRTTYGITASVPLDTFGNIQNTASGSTQPSSGFATSGSSAHSGTRKPLPTLPSSMASTPMEAIAGKAFGLYHDSPVQSASAVGRRPRVPVRRRLMTKRLLDRARCVDVAQAFKQLHIGLMGVKAAQTVADDGIWLLPSDLDLDCVNEN